MKLLHNTDIHWNQWKGEPKNQSVKKTGIKYKQCWCLNFLLGDITDGKTSCRLFPLGLLSNKRDLLPISPYRIPFESDEKIMRMEETITD